MDKLNYAIFAVSKQVQREAYHAGWTGNFKHFLDVNVLYEVVNAPITPIAVKWLAKLRLDLTMAQFYNFFGISIDPTLQIASTTPPASILKEISMLKYFDLFFNSP
jgi:hypothetical protein